VIGPRLHRLTLALLDVVPSRSESRIALSDRLIARGLHRRHDRQRLGVISSRLHRLTLALLDVVPSCGESRLKIVDPLPRHH